MPVAKYIDNVIDAEKLEQVFDLGSYRHEQPKKASAQQRTRGNDCLALERKFSLARTGNISRLLEMNWAIGCVIASFRLSYS